MPERINFKYPDTERKLLDRSGFSAMQWEVAMPMFCLPETLAGLKILDIGAGASDMVAELISRDADTYGVDPRYGDSIGNIEALAKLSINPRFDDLMRRRRLEVIERFVKSFGAKAEHYKAASVTLLPFDDNFFDIVYSLNTITVYLDHSLAALRSAVSECLRVTKPGGMVQLNPYMEREVGFDSSTDKRRLENQKMVFDTLKKHYSITIQPNETPSGLPNETIILKKNL